MDADWCYQKGNIGNSGQKYVLAGSWKWINTNKNRRKSMSL